MTEQRKPFFELQCLDYGHRFLLEVERREDISVTEVDSLDGTPLILFRDRTLVLCPVCKTSYCHMTGVRGEMEVKYTPEGANA